MNKNSVIVLLILSLVLALLPGCSNPMNTAASALNTAASGNAAAAGTGTGATSANSAANELQPEAQKDVQNTIGKYFEKLYSEAIDSYGASNATGAIPEGIKSYIAERTLKEGNMNPELPINFPRYVGINGLTAVSYSIGKTEGESDEESSLVEVSYLGKKDDIYVFFAKVNLMTDCADDITFNSCYKQNATTKVYEKIPNTAINQASIERIKLQAGYNVKVIEQDGEYKILSAMESSQKDDVKNRLFVLNNDFITRMPYLDITKTPDGKGYVNKEDGAVYDKETAVISELIENMKALDDQRMSLLRQRWATGQKEFSDFLALTEVNKDEDSKQLMSIGTDFRSRFDIDSFPLQSNMEKIMSLKNMTIVPYISYSSKQKVYSVKFEASVRKINGLIDSEASYKYNYKVKLAGSEDNLRVSEIRLNEYFGINN